MKYIDFVGNLPEAIELVRTRGGRLYAGKYRDSSHTVVIGNECYTFWSPKSKSRAQVYELCRQFNVPTKGQTGARLARWVIEELIELPFKRTYWDRIYRNVAKSGEHWHYNYVNPNKHFYGVEFDLKSAYFNSLFAGQSLLYSPRLKYLNDNGALERLKDLTPMFPKWFRLQLLGIMASWRYTYMVRPKNMSPNSELITKVSHHIGYGAGFNAVHRAIIRNYKIMRQVHRIGGKYIERMHTDSFLLNIECPENIEQDIHSYLEEKKVETDIKTAGYSYFFDLNTGYVGKSFIGAKVDVLARMRQEQIKMKRDGGYNVVLSKYEQQELIKARLLTLQNAPKEVIITEPRQLEIFDLKSFGMPEFSTSTDNWR